MRSGVYFSFLVLLRKDLDEFSWNSVKDTVGSLDVVRSDEWLEVLWEWAVSPATKPNFKCGTRSTTSQTCPQNVWVVGRDCELSTSCQANVCLIEFKSSRSHERARLIEFPKLNFWRP